MLQMSVVTHQCTSSTLFSLQWSPFSRVLWSFKPLTYSIAMIPSNRGSSGILPSRTCRSMAHWCENISMPALNDYQPFERYRRFYPNHLSFLRHIYTTTRQARCKTVPICTLIFLIVSLSILCSMEVLVVSAVLSVVENKGNLPFKYSTFAQEDTQKRRPGEFAPS
jgi:hypothetical protein